MVAAAMQVLFGNRAAWYRRTIIGGRQSETSETIEDKKTSKPSPELRLRQGVRVFDSIIRDQEAGGSNPLAPTTSKFLPVIGLHQLFR
jgi:hypothetical protein